MLSMSRFQASCLHIHCGADKITICAVKLLTKEGVFFVSSS